MEANAKNLRQTKPRLEKAKLQKLEQLKHAFDRVIKTYWYRKNGAQRLNTLGEERR